MVKKLLLTTMMVVSTSSIALEGLPRNIQKAKIASDCSASFLMTGQIKIMFNQQSDFESERLLAYSPVLLYLASAYSTQREAYQFYEVKEKKLNYLMREYVGDGSRRKLIANFVAKELAPFNNTCLSVVDDANKKDSILSKELDSDEGRLKYDDIINKTLGSLHKDISNKNEAFNTQFYNYKYRVIRKSDYADKAWNSLTLKQRESGIDQTQWSDSVDLKCKTSEQGIPFLKCYDDALDDRIRYISKLSELKAE